MQEPLVLAPRDDWPAGERGRLQRRWELQVRMAAEPCTVGRADITCSGELLATPSAPAADLASGPSYVVRAVGPTIEVCNTTVVPKTAHAGSAFVTRFACRVQRGGVWELRPLLTYETQEEAYGAASPTCKSPCVCSDLKMSNASFPSFVAPHALLATGGGRGGRWSWEAGGKWSFRRDDDRASTLDLSSVLPSPDACPMLYLVGDSHTRRVFEFLDRRGFKVKYAAAIGIQDHWINKCDKVLKDAERGNCSYRAFVGGKQGHSLLKFVSTPVHRFPELTKDDVVVVGAGTWDLRDSPVADFVRDFELLLQKLAKVSGKARFVYRTAPAFSYRRTRFTARDARTNERLVEANAKVLQMLPPTVGLWDSLSVTLPRLEESCDSHHYLCPNQELDNISVGVADLSLFLSSICDMQTPQTVDFVGGAVGAPPDFPDLA